MLTQQILAINGLHKQYGIKTVLTDVELTLNVGERAVLVGENGTGKTTLARIIAGIETCDAGSITWHQQAIYGYLPQEVTTDDNITIREYIENALGGLNTLQQQMQTLENQMTQADVDLETVLEAYAQVQDLFERRGGYDLDSRLGEIMQGLSIDYLEQERTVSSLSGGEKTRVALASLLLREPDLLILDEPTNHLDFAGIRWLENYLANYSHALLVITHDREFINAVGNQIIELNPTTHNLKIYYGNYDDYLAQREREYAEAVAEYHQWQNDIASMKRVMKNVAHNTKKNGAFTNTGDKFLKQFKTERGDGLVSRTIKSAKQRLETLEENPVDNPRHFWRIEFAFEPLPLTSQEPIRFTHLSKRYDDNILFHDINASVRKGERIVLLAPNGTGKTTLLRCLMGYDEADTGNIQRVGSATIGYLDQEGETLNHSERVLDCLRVVAGGDDKDLQAILHRSGLFTDASLHNQRVGELSVGQRRKLGLARLIASQANVLLLDEPTNHLDLLSLEALEDAFMQFEGAILAVSHDRRFIERVATQVWRLQDGELRIETINR